MPDVICNTSPMQYLHQLGLLHLLPKLVGRVIVPPAVIEELKQGSRLGVDLPDLSAVDWIEVREPISINVLPLVTNLGPGETQVLALGMEMPGAVLILDDALARQVGKAMRLPIRGTLGLLLDAKQAGLILEVKPLLDQLSALRFRLSRETYDAVLKLAGE